MTEELDQFILTSMPYFIAAQYKRMLDAPCHEDKVRATVRVYEVGIRTLALSVVSQYLMRDYDRISNAELNQLLEIKLPNAVLNVWQRLFFVGLEAYGENRHLLFIPELYDFYWDTSAEPHVPRLGIRAPFTRLTQIRDNLEWGPKPRDEGEWQALCGEAVGLLKQVLSAFAFFQNYELIRIVKQEGRCYWYESHTGLEIKPVAEPLETDQELGLTWFYLSKERQDFLKLHPLLIMWQDVTDEVDVAVYDRYIKRDEVLQFLTITLWRKILDETNVQDFIRMLYYTLDVYKRQRETYQELSWWKLKEVARSISEQQMAAVSGKYQTPLYLQRDKVQAAFERFLASDKVGFVLVGQSGVGKSNFVLDLAERHKGYRSDICVLMYDGARLDPGYSLTAIVNEDFDRFVKLRGEKIVDIWQEIARIESIEERKVVLIVDAINENPQGREVLGRINDLVVESNLPWLKVVVTSRPEAWRSIKRGLRLAEARYYREAGGDRLEVEMKPFSYSERLDPFTQGELPDVYEKYKEVFGLQTDYLALPSAVRRALRDPLLLRLVAETYQEGDVPPTFKPAEAYETYLDGLVESGLRIEDLRFLRQDLMPLMLREGHYANAITAQQVDTETTQDGKSLFELIHNDGLLEDGRCVNQSYRNLVDAGLLVQRGTALDYEIGFQYERDYEFFAGEHLHTSSQKAPDPVEFYRQVIAALRDHLFLWGALIRALALDLSGGNSATFLALFPEARENRLLRSALTGALTDFGEKNLKDAEALVARLVGSFTSPPATVFGDLWRLLRPIKPSSPELPVEQSIGVGVAARLQMTEFLENAAADPSPQLRAAAALHTFYLWKQDPEKGFQVLEGLSRRATGRHGLPDVAVAESMLAISGAIMAQEPRNLEALARLLTVGRGALRKILRLGELQPQAGASKRLIGVGTSFLRRQVLNALLGYAMGIMANWEGHATITPAHLGHVFELSAEQKRLLESLVPFLDPHEPGLEERFEDLVDVNNWGDAMGCSIVEMAVLSHGVVDFAGTLPLLRKYLDATLSHDPPRFWVNSPSWIAQQIAMRQDTPNPKLREFFERVAQAIQKDARKWATEARKGRPIPYATDSRATCLGAAITSAYLYQGDVRSDLVERCLEEAMARGDDEYLMLYVEKELTILFESGLPVAALQALRHIAWHKSAEVQKAIIKLLVRGYRYDPELVEDLLLQGGFPSDIAEHVLATPSSERLDDLMTFQLATVLYDLFLLGPEPLRLELQWLILQSLQESTLRKWLKTVAGEILNLLAGEVVFAVPDDAPSRKLPENSNQAHPTRVSV